MKPGGPAMLTRIFALTLGLLAVATPARASTVEIVTLNFGDGYTANGTISFLGPVGPPPQFFVPFSNFSLYLNGIPVPPMFVDVGLGNPIKEDPVFFNICGVLPCPFPGPVADSISWPIDHIPTNFAEFTLAKTFNGDDVLNRGNGTPAISGDVVFATPLPAALPLFGSGVIALAGFAVRRRGKVSA
jgi:hypothetical protein